MVFQGPSLIPALNVVENVALSLLLAGAAKTKRCGAPSWRWTG
jgi:ABC-type taurine transport system ATPase subunit